MGQVRVGIIGYGYWGPNLLRNFAAHRGCSVEIVCDQREAALAKASQDQRAIRTTTRYRQVLTDRAIDAVVIATPVSTHFRLAKEALLAGKHILVEKPFTQNTLEARILEKLARERKKQLMVDHTFIYTPAVQKIRKIVTSNALGDIYYIDCVRTNLGVLQQDTNVIGDLATHDFSIIDFVIGSKPQAVSATGIAYPATKQESIAQINAWYQGGLFVHTHVSWLSPLKIRTMMIVGTRKMLFYDDMEPSEKIKLYDKSVLVGEQLRIGYRTGSMIAPHLPIREGLAGVAEAFIRGVRRGITPVTNGKQGLRVVAIVEAATSSMKLGGTIIKLP